MPRPANARCFPNPSSLRLACLAGLAAALTACTPPAAPHAAGFLTSNDAQSTLVVEAADCKGCKPGPRTFYLVTPEQLGRVRGASGLVYLGTEGEHHFFRAWNKLLEPPEIDHVAVSAASCSVADAGSFEAERARTKYRSVDLTSGCTVR